MIKTRALPILLYSFPFSPDKTLIVVLIKGGATSILWNIYKGAHGVLISEGCIEAFFPFITPS